MTILDGKKIAKDLRSEIKSEIEMLSIKPKLVAIIVGKDPASVSYVTAKHKACMEVGIESEVRELPADISEEDLLDIVENYNKDVSVHGILVQLPLPKHIDPEKVITKIDQLKDVDGFHPISLGKLLRDQDTFLSATPYGIREILVRSGYSPAGKHVVVVGRSNIVGKPMANILLGKGEAGDATVTVVHSKTKDLAKFTKMADILIVAIGKPKFITADMVRDGAVVIDVGVNRVEDSSRPRGFRLVGDTDYENLINKVEAITPVPGGVGPMTITMLLKNTLDAAKKI